MTLKRHTREELALRKPLGCKRFVRNGFQLDLYAPWWATPSFRKLKTEIGFQISLRDPRSSCDHHYPAVWPKVGSNSKQKPYCSNCYQSLDVSKSKVLRPKPTRNWRVIKLYAASTASPKRRPHGVIMIEAATHLTDNTFKRLSTKVFVRFKMGFGGPLI